MDFFNFIWNHWLILAFVAPFLWALVNIIDVYFVHSAYRTPEDGTIISGLFQIFPWFLVVFGIIQFQWPSPSVIFLAFGGGFLFLFAFFFYFRSLFAANDVALLQVLWNISVPLVPILAWIFIGERLPLSQYFGIAVVFFGATVLVFDREFRINRIKKMFVPMSMAVLLLSSSMILEDQAYMLSQGNNFWNVYLLFSAGNVFSGMLVWIFSRDTFIFKLVGKYFATFFVAELLALLGFIASQRTIDISPSVSFVAAIESIVPIFVIIISFLLIWFGRLVPGIISKKGLKKLYRDQTTGLSYKLMATVIMLVGIYWIS